MDPTGLQTCAAEHCTTAGPYPEQPEGTILFRAEVEGRRCGQSGTKVKFYLKEVTYLGPGRVVYDRNGRPSPCGQPVNDELNQLVDFLGSIRFTYGDKKPGCTSPSQNFHAQKDSHGCWVLDWSWECQLACVERRCSPRSFKMGIYGPRTPGDDPHGGHDVTFGISAWSLQAAAQLKIVDECCHIGLCSIQLALDWQSFFYDDVGPPPDFQPIRPRVPAPNNCSPEDRQRVGDAPSR